MSAVKARLIEVIEGQPEDATVDEILHELAFERMVERGLDDVRAGRTVSDEEVEKTTRPWTSRASCRDA